MRGGYTDLQAFLRDLERAGELRRVKLEVDPELEVTEIATRMVKEEGPALLFERVKGSRYPLAINVLASRKRIEMALGIHPRDIGEELVRFAERVNPPSLKKLWESRAMVKRLLSARLKRVGGGPCQEVVETEPNLHALPILKCWPGDGGRFITFPLVITHSPADGRSNLGIYRMHLYSHNTTGMHWQIQKGGGFHYWEAEQRNQPLEVAVAIGADPILLLGAVLPLPEGIEELVFSGFLRRQPTRMVKTKTLSLHVPATAEFVLEGVVPPKERATEGPFGDHFGHYSEAAPFPVFHLKAITRKKDPVYLAAVVGKPPQEDRYLGDAVQDLLQPIVKLMHPEIDDLWAYYQASFHNLLVVSVKTRYTKEPMKTALGLMGTGQVSLTKCAILVDAGVNARDIHAVLRAVAAHFRPEDDFLLLPRVPLDTLDFTSFKMHLGSKMVLDATSKGLPNTLKVSLPQNVAGLAPGIQRWRLLDDTLLVAQVEGPGRPALQHMLDSGVLSGLPMLAAVSPDVNIEDDVQLLWGIFTRFDCARDVLFPHMELQGASPVYRGTLAIDATFKQGYPAPLEMTKEVIERVDKRWDQYWR